MKSSHDVDLGDLGVLLHIVFTFAFVNICSMLQNIMHV